MQQTATARTDPGNSGRESWCAAAAVAAVVTVNVVYVTPAGVGTVCKEKLHVAPAGNPAEQVNETLELNPPTSCTVMVVVPLCPAWTVTDAGLIATVKSGGIM